MLPRADRAHDQLLTPVAAVARSAAVAEQGRRRQAAGPSSAALNSGSMVKIGLRPAGGHSGVTAGNRLTKHHQTRRKPLPGHNSEVTRDVRTLKIRCGAYRRLTGVTTSVDSEL